MHIHTMHGIQAHSLVILLNLSQNVKKMVEHINTFYQLNIQIFVTLNKCLTTSDIIGQQAREYQPPLPAKQRLVCAVLIKELN